LAERYDWLSPAILRFLRRVLIACRESNTPVTICGEMGGRALEAMALLAIGFERLSITPAAIPPVKAMVRSLDLSAAKPMMEKLLADPPRNLRDALGEWARSQSVDIA
jgi:phosphotransferase system enzyme I (PtsP)